MHGELGCRLQGKNYPHNIAVNLSKGLEVNKKICFCDSLYNARDAGLLTSLNGVQQKKKIAFSTVQTAKLDFAREHEGSLMNIGSTSFAIMRTR